MTEVGERRGNIRCGGAFLLFSKTEVKKDATHSLFVRARVADFDTTTGVREFFCCDCFRVDMHN